MRRLLKRASAFVTGLAFGLGTVQADTITFNNGRQPLECRVLEDEKGSETVLVEIKVTETIRDRMILQRSEIAKITMVPRDKMDFEELRKKVVPTPDMLSVEDYQRRIAMLKPFLSQYPTSEYVDQVQKLIALLGTEQMMVARGGVKLDDEWIPPEERQKRKYNIDADMMYRTMKGLADSHREYEAIQLFEQIEEKYPASIIFSDAVLLARDLIPKIETDLQKMIIRQPTLVKEREDGLRALEEFEVEHNRTKKAIEAELREFQQIVEREKLARAKWITYYAYDLESLENALDVVRKEGNRLSEYNVGVLRTSAGLTSKVMEFLHLKDLDKAESYLKQAEANGGDRSALNKFRKEIARLRKEAKEGTKDNPPPVVPDPGDKPDVKPPSRDPVGDLTRDLETPVAKRARELEEEKQRAAEEAKRKAAEAEAAAAAAAASNPADPTIPAVVPDGVDPTGTPETPETPDKPDTPETPTDPTGETPVVKPPSEAVTKPVVAPAPKTSTEKPSETATPAKTGGGLPLWNYILMGLAGLLILVTVIAKVTQKKEAAPKEE